MPGVSVAWLAELPVDAVAEASWALIRVLRWWMRHRAMAWLRPRLRCDEAVRTVAARCLLWLHCTHCACHCYEDLSELRVPSLVGTFRALGHVKLCCAKPLLHCIYVWVWLGWSG